MKKQLELLAPGGDVDCVKAAILAGANAVYCGLEKFSARDRASNISWDDLHGVVRLAHAHHCSIFITLNIVLVESEIPSVVKILNRLANIPVDGVIVQDIGLLYLLQTWFPAFTIHASTQLTTHNTGQLRFLRQLSVARVNLSREMNIDEIKIVTAAAHELEMATEVFVHGSNCISFSGLCYMSSVKYGNSGNRGRCSQPCREEYHPTSQGRRFPLNLKDNSAFDRLGEIRDAGVDSIKIEGRIKKSNYVFTVVRAYREQLQRLYDGEPLSQNQTELYTVYNRDFTSGFLAGQIHREMYIDNPKDFSPKYLLAHSGAISDEDKMRANKSINQAKKRLIDSVKKDVGQLSVEKIPLVIRIMGIVGHRLEIEVSSNQFSFTVHSQSVLVPSDDRYPDTGFNSALSVEDHLTQSAFSDGIGSTQLNEKMFRRKLRAINEMGYVIDQLDTDALAPNVFMSYEEIAYLRKQILFVLNGNAPLVSPIPCPVPTASPPVTETTQKKSALSVLISSMQDLHLCRQKGATFYFELPNRLQGHVEKFAGLFRSYPTLHPWFPAVLMGSDYTAAVELLHLVGAGGVVTNNWGIAYEAFCAHIPWIAGPFLNIANSFSLQCLKEKFNCAGAYLSNELNANQMNRLTVPSDFRLGYSMFHPILLMTSRQCLFHQVTGCAKEIVDEDCIENCQKQATIDNLKDITSFIEKSCGKYLRVFFERHFLNTQVVMDENHPFSEFLIDLSDIDTRTHMTSDKFRLIELFRQYVDGNPDCESELHAVITPTTQNQYLTGV